MEREAATGSTEAKVKLLMERVRIGALTEKRMQLAAYLGDAGAQVALAAPIETPRQFKAWVRDLYQWEAETPLRVVVAAMHWLRIRKPESVLAELCQELREASEAWVVSGEGAPSEAIAAAERLSEAWQSLRTLNDEESSPGLEEVSLTDLIKEVSRLTALGRADLAAHEAAREAVELLRFCGETAEVGEPELREIVTAELLPWALGERDLLKERVEGRKK